MTEKIGAVLVVGAGVGGLRSSLDLAESGFKVYLTDDSPAIGGTLAQVDEWFPDNQCEMCKLLPDFSRDECSQLCLRRDMAHPNIQLIPNSRVEKVDGKAGNFEVSLKVESRWVKSERCTGCGLCVDACPVEVPDAFNEGLKNRKAIYIRNPQAIPNVYIVDREHCTKCGKCMAVCPINAIDLNLPDESRKLSVGAVIISTGSEEFDATKMGQYGFNHYANVLNNIKLERMLASAGCTGGELVRPSDGKAPQSVAFLQCVGSRDMERQYCSAACCMYALKEAILIKEQDPNIDVTIFYMDMRAFGKGYYRYHLKAKELGVNFLRCRVSRIRESPKTENLLLLARSEDGKSISREFDLVVLSVGQCPSPRTAELSKVLGVDINQWGFIKTQDLWLVRTSKEGIFSAGAEAPVDISETVTRASAAACEASLLLSPARKMQAGKKVKSKKLPSGDEDVRVAIIICRCGQEIASVLDMKDLASFAASLPGVVHVEEVDYLCLPETMEKVKQAITKSRANRVIFAACTPYHYQRLFDGVLQEVGIDSSLWQLLNFREQLAWVHKDTRPMAIEKAHSLLAMAIERLKVQQTLSVSSTSVNHRGLVIGGGISGIITSMCLAEQGFEVHLVEKDSKLKGHITDMYYDLENKDLQAFSNSICQRIETNNRIHVHLKSEVVELTGQVGDFKTKIKTGNEVTTIQNGVVIIATGAKDYQPTEYKYGSDKRIITQKELQKRLVNGIPDKLSRVVMIQCVGSRDDKQPWCSRACCSEAIANALKIKEQNPDVNVFILNRDIMTYGLKEEEYIRARESGILFLRYEPDKKPEINIKDRTIVIQIDDPALPGRLQIEADLLVLSTGIIPGENKELAKILSLELNEDGFFKEIDTKFRPVDTIIDGIFICGLANAPRCLGEEIIQAEAAAQRAANVLAKERLESGRFISEVNARKCSGCGLCVTVCPYKARWIDEEKKVAVVREAICQGCGACVAVCPSSAAKLRGLKDNQVFAMIEAAL